MNITDYKEQHSGVLATLTLAGTLVLLTAACDEIDGGVVQNEIPLPTDTTLNLFCENEGIFPDQCVLDNPANPYASIGVNGELEDNDPDEPNKIRKFVLSDDAPSAKARFYVWATALAQSPQGENQYFTALSLHELYTQTGSEIVQEQARKAYRSVLDNFFGSVTFFEVTYLPGEVFFPAQLTDLVGNNLYDPASVGLAPLYPGDPVLALDAIGEWGYTYNIDLGIVFINE